MMKKLTTFILMAAGTSLADSLFIFDPNDLINLYTAGAEASYRPAQENPRFIFQRIPKDYSTMASTFTDHPDRGSRWIGNADRYADWLEGLGEGEGIQSFNIWVTTAGYLGSYGNTYSRTDILQQMYSISNNVAGWSGTGWGDWQAQVTAVYSNATDGVSYGIRWSTTNAAAYLRPGGMDIGSFSFTLSDVAVNSNGDSPVAGQNYNFWFGSYDVVFDETGWGTRSTGAVFSSTADNHAAGWEGSMVLPAQAVPEPSVTSLAGLAAAILFMRRSIRWQR